VSGCEALDHPHRWTYARVQEVETMSIVSVCRRSWRWRWQAFVAGYWSSSLPWPGAVHDYWLLVPLCQPAKVKL
jgi:hypothetical protein